MSLWPNIYWAPEFADVALSMYLQGAAVAEISAFTGISIDEVNEILDIFAPYLGG